MGAQRFQNSCHQKGNIKQDLYWEPINTGVAVQNLLSPSDRDLCILEKYTQDIAQH